MKLKTTKIKDFQSLGSVEIEHGDLTVLWGSSDLGKSACIRAIRALHRNTSSSDNIRHGKTKLKIEQIFDDGSSVSFEKSKTTNSYNIDGKVLSKVGRDIPEDVSEVLKTYKLILDKDQSLDLNFSTQFEGPFLLTDSVSIITKTISSLSGIHYIYSALREAASQSQKLKSQIQVLSSNVSSLIKFDSLKLESDNIVYCLGELEKVDLNIKKEEAFLSALSNVLESTRQIEKREFDPSKIIDFFQVTFLEFNTISTKEENIVVLLGVLDRIKFNENRTINPLEVILKFKGVQDDFFRWQDEELGINDLKELLVKIDKRYFYSDFNIKFDEISNIYAKLNTIFSNVGSQEDNFVFLKELKNRFDVSKLCDDDFVELLRSYLSEESEIKNKIKICESCGRAL